MAYPREIPVEGGPNIIVNSQEEADAFMEAAQANSRALRSDRMRRHEEAVERGESVRIVALFNSDLARPTAPLALCGPFDSREGAEDFASKWDSYLAHPSVRVVATYLPSVAEFEAHLTGGGFDLAVWPTPEEGRNDG